MKLEEVDPGAARIYAEWTAYLDRQHDSDWPDVWSPGYDRWMYPEHLTLAFRQPRNQGVRLIVVSALCRKRWRNSKRLTSPDTHYGLIIWEMDGPVPEWVIPIAREALSRINPVSEPERRAA